MAPRGPTALGPLIGREEDLDLLLARLDPRVAVEGVRLVTLTGPPGGGKTTLALHLSARYRRDGGACAFVDLADARSHEDIALAIGRALGIASDEHGGLGSAQIARTLRGAGRALLVLDNFEQLAPTAEEGLRPLLDGAPELLLLVTSRERLKLKDELVHALSPLALPAKDERDRGAILAGEAVRLLLDRRARAGVSSPPEGDEVFAIRDLVRALDGWPLAIELAAARLSVMTARMLLGLLGDRFEVLSEATGNEGRSKRLLVAIEWSFSLLPPRARRALVDATSFEGGFDLLAAEAVLLDEGEPRTTAIDLVQALHDASLLFARQGERGMRYTPYVSVADYARTQQSEGERLEGRRRHAQHYLERARAETAELGGPSATLALAWLAEEELNLAAIVRRGLGVASLEALVRLDPLRTLRGPLDRHEAELTRALESVEDAPADLLVKARNARGRARALLARPEEAEADLREAASSAETSVPLELDAALLDLGVFLRARGRMDEAADALERAAAIARSSNDPMSEARALAQLGILRKERGDLSGARQAYESALAAFRSLGDRRGEGRTLCDLGALEQEERAFASARAAFDAALQIVSELGDVRLEAIARSDSGCLSLEMGRPERAEEDLARAVTLLESVGDRRYAALFRGARAAALAQLGRLEEASDLLFGASLALSRADDRLFLGAVEVHGAHLALARAQRVRLDGGENDALRAEAEDKLAAAQRRVNGEPALSELSDDVRFAARVLERALAAGRAPVLKLGPSDAYVEVPGRGRIELGRRPVLRRLLVALVAAHRAGAEGVSAQDLVRAGWPGERIASSAARNRLAVALNALRELGLRELIVRTPSGQRLPADLVLVSEDRPG